MYLDCLRAFIGMWQMNTAKNKVRGVSGQNIQAMNLVGCIASSHALSSVPETLPTTSELVAYVTIVLLPAHDDQPQPTIIVKHMKIFVNRQAHSFSHASEDMPMRLLSVPCRREK